MNDASPSGSSRTPRRLPLRLLIRVALYLAVIVVLWVTREDLRDAIPFGRDTGRLVLAGMDAAPALTDDLASWFTSKYPDVDVTRREGTSLQALEDLLNGRCDVAFSLRPPTDAEQSLFRRHTGDAALCYPVAVGAIQVLANGSFPAGPVSVREIRAYLLGEDGAHRLAISALYVPDPNGGEWDVLLDRLDMAATDRAAAEERVTFLADAAAVERAIAADERALGIRSGWGGRPSGRVRGLLLDEEAGPPTEVRPDFETVAGGGYPLYHHLYVCCREADRREASRFVTLVTDGPGQRHVERAGFIPARWTAREVILTREGGEG